MQIEEYKPLAALTTFGIGGAARWFVQARGEQEISEAVAWASERSCPLFILGGGSNLLVSDRGFEGLVLQIALRGVKRSNLSGGGNALCSAVDYSVAAGEEWDSFVALAVAENCAGVECLAGIPGTVGGTPVQNVGAYGQEVASTIARVRAFDRAAGTFVELAAAECGFAYRHSRFNSTDRDRFIVTRVDYRLTENGVPSLQYADLKRSFTEGAKPTLTEVAEAVRQIRRTKGMLLVEGESDCRSAGSFFKNPVVADEVYREIAAREGQIPPCFRMDAAADRTEQVKIPAAWLIERAGFTKGYRRGRAGISTRHPLALINCGGAQAEEIVALRDEIAGTVEARFGVALQMEPVMLGF